MGHYTDNRYYNDETKAWELEKTTKGGLSSSNDLLCLRTRKVSETMQAGDVVLFDEMFVPIGFATQNGHYYAGQIVTTSMTGKVICKAT